MGYCLMLHSMSCLHELDDFSVRNADGNMDVNPWREAGLDVFLQDIMAQKDISQDADSIELVTYAWKTEAWGSCVNTTICQHSRTVKCEDGTGEEVAEEYCDPAIKPAVSESCPPPCYGNKTLDPSQACKGVVLNSTPSTSSGKESCRIQCITWGQANSYSSWCCQLSNVIPTPGSWFCTIYSQNGVTTKDITADTSAGLGRCNFYP